MAEPSVIDTYKMKIISLLISLFGIIKTKALECVSIVNEKCMPRPEILDGGIGMKVLVKLYFIRIMY